jgi:hypothetical protein
MFAVHHLPPCCPACHHPMRLVHVLTNQHVYPPVRTFECALCQTDTITQSQPVHHANHLSN